MNMNDIAPYGRSHDEYRRMFSLSDDDGARSILGIGDGLSDFNLTASKRGWRVVSVDPLYQFSAGALENRMPAVIDHMVDAVAMVPTHWAWSLYPGPAALKRQRLETARAFIEDFVSVRGKGRYVAAGLPRLPFRDDTFDVALCSHLLFAWSAVLDLEFHIRAIDEMLRVASEVRVFPTGKNFGVVRSKHVDAVVAQMRARGIEVSSRHMPGQPPNASTEQLVFCTPRQNRAIDVAATETAPARIVAPPR
jgi:hypothetical protein